MSTHLCITSDDVEDIHVSEEDKQVRDIIHSYPADIQVMDSPDQPNNWRPVDCTAVINHLRRVTREETNGLYMAQIEALRDCPELYLYYSY